VGNTGKRAGSDVAQLYVGLPQPRPGVVQPPRQLKAFRKVELGKGKRKRLTLSLDARSLSYWNVGSGGWRVAPGCYPLAVGRSSRDLVLRGELAVGGASCAKGAVTLPGVCKRNRSVRIRIKGVRPSRVRRVAVYVNGHRRRVLRGHRGSVRVKLGKGKVTKVRLVIRTRRHRTLRMKRTLRLCA
jgi:hypothetical protein